MPNKLTNIIAAVLLIFVFVICVFSMKDDSLTMDELAHIPAGYSYLVKQDMRLNPEHPPLVKDLAALPLLFIRNIKFPDNIKAWTTDTNGQWDFGSYFFYKTGNPVSKIIFFARIPMVLLLLLLGLLIFKLTKKKFGNEAGLLSLFLFSLSPTFLAHGRLVTTDIGAAFGAMLATFCFVKALKEPKAANVIIAGIAFGMAETLKFSLILLVPLFIFFALISLLRKTKVLQALKTTILVFFIGCLLIYPVYLFHTLNYPKTRQIADIKVYLKDYPEIVKRVVLFNARRDALRPYAQYLTGLLMTFQRAAGGNTTYFMGEVNNEGWRTYFPIIYFIKETLAFHIFTLIAVISVLIELNREKLKNPLKKFKEYLLDHFEEFASLCFIALYVLASLSSKLNLGIRHLLPIFPFIIFLIAGTISKLLKEPYLKSKYVILGGLLLFQMASVLMVFPSFLSYFNEFVGGADKGYIYATDSNLDWGQDLKRLEKWTEKNNIRKIYIDYFGGGDPKYYLKEKFSSWWGDRNKNELPKGSYLAVSLTLLQGGRGVPAKGFKGETGYYNWLNNFTPVANIGHSIFVYKIE